MKPCKHKWKTISTYTSDSRKFYNEREHAVCELCGNERETRKNEHPNGGIFVVADYFRFTAVGAYDNNYMARYKTRTYIEKL